MEAKLDLVLAIFVLLLGGRFLKRTGAVYFFFSKQKRQKYDHKVLPNVQMCFFLNPIWPAKDLVGIVRIPS